MSFIKQKVVNISEVKNGQMSDSVVEAVKRKTKSSNGSFDSKNISLTKLRQSMEKETLSFTKKNVDVCPLIIQNRFEACVVSPKEIKFSAVILFIHGGGFIGGNFYSYLHQLEYICEEAGCRAVAFNYRLAPENSFPSGYHDVIDAYWWVEENKRTYGWDSDSIILLGDSAGVNLGLLATFENPSINFCKIVNIYGAVDFSPKTNKKYQWSIDLYNISYAHESFLIQRLKKIDYLMELVNDFYFDRWEDTRKQLLNRDVTNKKIDMLYIEAEFDYFRFSNRYFISQLSDESHVKIIQYRGMDHGFFERLGHCDEALHCLNEIVDYIIQ